jgi:hypothetical protein
MALREGRPLVLIFTKPGCHACWLFNRRHLRNPGVRQALEQCVVVRKHQDPDEKRRYGIRESPTLVLYSFSQEDQDLRLADLVRGPRDETLIAKRCRDLARGRNRAEEAIELLREDPGDEEARFLVEHFYGPLLTAAQRARVP